MTPYTATPADLALKAYEANKAKLEQLIADGNAKLADCDVEDSLYWAGVVVGLKRALNVINGNG